ncbi:MAG: hypothetical protein IKF93_06755 [Lachnospiraceae bacterium]|nr:hypothetical protein [Lachnospiraceae bacterium]
MMRVTLARDTRIAYKAGDTIEVSPDLYKLLVETGSVEAAPEVADEMLTEAETPEKPKRTRKK